MSCHACGDKLGIQVNATPSAPPSSTSAGPSTNQGEFDFTAPTNTIKRMAREAQHDADDFKSLYELPSTVSELVTTVGSGENLTVDVSGGGDNNSELSDIEENDADQVVNDAQQLSMAGTIEHALREWNYDSNWLDAASMEKLLAIKPPVTDNSIAKKIEDGYVKLQAADDCTSLLKRHLTPAVIDQLKKTKTKSGFTLWDVIQSGVVNVDSRVGVYAPDVESYTTFKALFDLIIKEFHGGFSPSAQHPPPYFGLEHLIDLAELDQEGKYIISTRVSCRRSIRGFDFKMTKAEWEEMEVVVQDIFSSMPNVLKGKYYPLTGVTSINRERLTADRFMFNEGDRFLKEANAYRHWPTGRGVFHNDKKTFLVWVGEEDHLRIFSMQPDGNIFKAVGRLIDGLFDIMAKMSFSRDDRLGWLTMCPTNLGTALQASIRLKIPKTSARLDFTKICDDMNLQIGGLHGEHSQTEGGVIDISNKQCLGVTEFEAVKSVYDGVKKLIELEEATA